MKLHTCTCCSSFGSAILDRESCHNNGKKHSSETWEKSNRLSLPVIFVLCLIPQQPGGVESTQEHKAAIQIGWCFTHCAAGNEINPVAKSLAGVSPPQGQGSLELPTEHTDPKATASQILQQYLYDLLTSVARFL